jgi:transcription initiation factor IIE alpha subunit
MTSLDTKSIAAHVVVTLANAQAAGRVLRLDELASEIGIRKVDVRNVVTRLHAEGHVDALRLRLTMSGLALGAVLASCKLREPRQREQAISRVA